MEKNILAPETPINIAQDAAPTEQVSQDQPKIEKKKKSHSTLKTFTAVLQSAVLFIVIGSLIFVAYIFSQSLKASVHLETRNNPAGCKHDHCISFDGTYDLGSAYWEVQKGFPMKLTIAGPTFSQNNIPITIRCPVTQQRDDEFITKLTFLMTQERIDDCVVTAR